MVKGSLCRFCGQPIKWLKTRNNKNMPCDPVNIQDGDVFDKTVHTSHWDTCAKRDNARQKYPQQDDILNAFLKTKLEEYVNAVKAGMGYEQLGRKFLEAVENTHKPKAADMFDADDQRMPF